MEYLQIESGAQVLVLNADYNPINVCSYRRAVVLALKNKVQVLSKRVVRLLNYIKIPFYRLSEERPTRNLIFKRDNHKCAYCGATENLTIDHILPSSRGGKDTWENLTASCTSCNAKKGNKTPEEANMVLSNNPKAPYNKVHLTVHTSNVNEWKEYMFY